MASHYNINRSIEAYEFRMIDPADGQLKRLTDIPSLGGGGGGDGYTDTQIDAFLALKANQATTYTKTEVDTSLGLKANTADVYTQSQIDTSLGLKANLVNPVFTANATVSSILNATAVDTAGLTANAVNTNQYYSSNLTADTTWTHNATEYMRYDYTNSTLEMKQELQIENGFKTDTLDSLTDTNLVMSRNGVEYMNFQAVPERIVMNKVISINGGRDKSLISEGIEGSFNVLRIRNLDETSPFLVLTCDDGVSSNNLTMSVSNTTFSKKVNCNTFNGNGDNDVVFERNGIEYFKLDGSNSIVNVASGVGLSAVELFSNIINSRAVGTDTVFYGANSDGVSTATVEYMRYDHANSMLNIVSGISFSGGLNSNILNTATDTNLQLQRNGVDYIRLTTDSRVKIDKQMDIEVDCVGLTINDSLDGSIRFRNGNQIDTTFVGGAVREMYLNYYSDGGVRIGNLDGYLTVNGARNGTDRLTVNGNSYLAGDITATSNINMLNQNRFYFGDRQHAREETNGVGKRLKFYGSNNADSFRFVVGLETFESARVVDISQNNLLVRGNIEAHKSWGIVKSNSFDTYDNENCILKRNAEEFMRFDTDGTVKFTKWINCIGGEGTSRIFEDIEGANNVLRVWNNAQVNGAITAIGAGNDANILLAYSNKIEARQPISCNTYSSNGNFNVLFQQNGSTYAFYDKDDVNYPSGIFKYDCDVSVNVVNFLQCQTLRAHIFDSHDTLEPDDVSWRYNGTTYMFYDNSLTRFQFNVDIQSSFNIECVALTETSDKRLKEQIEDVETDCSELVKKIKVKNTI